MFSLWWRCCRHAGGRRGPQWIDGLHAGRRGCVESINKGPLLTNKTSFLRECARANEISQPSWQQFVTWETQTELQVTALGAENLI